MIYTIFHETIFHYQGTVTFSHNIARLKPKEGVEQSLLDFRLDVEPNASEIHVFEDMFGNSNHHLLLREPHTELKVTGRSKVRRNIDQIAAAVAHLRSTPMDYAEALQRLSGFHPKDIAAKQFLFESELIPVGIDPIRDYALESFRPKRTLFEAGEELMGRIFDDFEFESGFSDITTPVEIIFEEKKGVCQDFAHFALSALRSIGLPVRYVSGYIETIPPEGEEKLFGADASHAWVSLYIPGAGWLDLDPTNNVIPIEQHIVLGHGRDYHDISPLKGVVRSSGSSHLSVMVDVRRSAEIETPVQQRQLQFFDEELKQQQNQNQ
jgi:transglutaminase-like putative cysteine protease